jgi:cell division protein FtsZ
MSVQGSIEVVDSAGNPFRSTGKAMMGTAVAGGPDRATQAADAAVAYPLLEGIDLSGARGVLVLIAAGKSSFKLAESRNAMNTIRRYASDDAHVIYGTAYDESLGDQLRVTVIATGLSSVRKGQITPPLSVVQQPAQHAHHAVGQQLRNGTDGLPILNQVAQPPVQASAAPQHSYEGLNTPSVWRSARSQAAAKVDALTNHGMDEIEIPAFLRKQAD